LQRAANAVQLEIVIYILGLAQSLSRSDSASALYSGPSFSSRLQNAPVSSTVENSFLRSAAEIL